MNNSDKIKQFGKQVMEMLDSKRNEAWQRQDFAREHKFQMESQAIQYEISAYDNAMCELRKIMRDFGINPYDL